jgi:branched-chain amino acid transport system substrate-binding protein
MLGIDGEFGLLNSTSAQAVELGVRLALHEINSAGGVLGGRKLDIVTKDHRSIAARGIRNMREFAGMPEIVAVYGGRFSPVVIEQLPILRSAKLPFLAVWSAADAIVDNGSNPNYVFRLSLRDSLAMPHMLKTAAQRGLQRVGLLLTNTAWGRSNHEAAQKFNESQGTPSVVAIAWYNWQEPSLLEKYRKLVAAGAQAIVLVANDDEAALLVREIAPLPALDRVPILSHWGVTGGKFVESAGPALRQVDFSVIQTFSFFRAQKRPLDRFMATAAAVANIHRVEDIVSPVGVAHAYDMTHILAKAITLARTSDRAAVRDALEKVREHQGLVRRYAPPFSSTRHEALGPEQLLMARYRQDGVLVPDTT